MTFDTVTNVLSWDISWTGLPAPVTVAHFHGPAGAGINAGVQVNWGAISGTSSPSIGSTTITDSQETDVLAGQWYINIHTSTFPGGEIRGQVEISSLPVELTQFTVALERGKARLHWETSSETNNAGFGILHTTRSTFQDSGSKWETLAFVEGQGTTSSPREYTYTTSDLDPGTHRFRLKQIDYDGISTFSSAVEVTVGLPGRYSMKAAYPNPFNPSTTIQFAVASDQRVLASLYNLLGNEVRSLGALSVTANKMHDLRIDAGGLPSGIYMVRLTGEFFSASQRVMLLK